MVTRHHQRRKGQVKPKSTNKAESVAAGVEKVTEANPATPGVTSDPLVAETAEAAKDILDKLIPGGSESSEKSPDVMEVDEQDQLMRRLAEIQDGKDQKAAQFISEYITEHGLLFVSTRHENYVRGVWWTHEIIRNPNPPQRTSANK